MCIGEKMTKILINQTHDSRTLLLFCIWNVKKRVSPVHVKFRATIFLNLYIFITRGTGTRTLTVMYLNILSLYGFTLPYKAFLPLVCSELTRYNSRSSASIFFSRGYLRFQTQSKYIGFHEQY